MLDASGNDLMFEFIRSCHAEKKKCENVSMFYILIDKCLLNVRLLDAERARAGSHSHSHCHSHCQHNKNGNGMLRARNKKIIRSMRLMHAWMTLSINNNKYWVFCELGMILKKLHDSPLNRHCNRIQIDYERIMGDLLCLCTLKRRFLMIQFMVKVLRIDVNLNCEGGETPLVCTVCCVLIETQTVNTMIRR